MKSIDNNQNYNGYYIDSYYYNGYYIDLSKLYVTLSSHY